VWPNFNGFLSKWALESLAVKWRRRFHGPLLRLDSHFKS
jgi:hypothetical protein